MGYQNPPQNTEGEYSSGGDVIEGASFLVAGAVCTRYPINTISPIETEKSREYLQNFNNRRDVFHTDIGLPMEETRGALYTLYLGGFPPHRGEIKTSIVVQIYILELSPRMSRKVFVDSRNNKSERSKNLEVSRGPFSHEKGALRYFHSA